MASNKERLSDLETGLGMVQDEMLKLNEGIADKFRNMEESFRQMLTEAVTNMREEGSSAPRGSRRDETTQPSGSVQRDNTNSLAPNSQNVPHRHVKLVFPKFSEGDPTAWMSKAKQYFAYQDLPNEQWVSFASYHLEDEANEWWQATAKTLREEGTLVTWDVFEEELWARFGPITAEDFDEALSKIRQTGALREYHKEFERLQNKVSGWTQKALIGTYIGGLKDNISDSVRMFHPKTLKATIELARMKDEQLQRQRRFNSFTNRNQRNPTPNTTTPPPPSKDKPKRLSWDELKRKRSLGLCFSCDERYTPDHRCQKSQLLLIEGVEDTDDDGDESDIPPTTDEPEITLQALTGWGSPKTIRTHTEIHHQKLIALIDSGSTHNFITDKVANRLNLKLTPTKTFDVRVADGHPIRCTGVYRRVQATIDGVLFQVDFFPLPITGQDLVLGI